MTAIFQTTYSNAFSWMKIVVFWWQFHWNLFPKVQLTIFQHWTGAKPLSEPMVMISLTHICITWPQWVKDFREIACWVYVQNQHLHKLQGFSAIGKKFLSRKCIKTLICKMSSILSRPQYDKASWGLYLLNQFGNHCWLITCVKLNPLRANFSERT